MNEARFRLSLAAEQDLDRLFDYIATESGANRAGMILQRIERALDLLAFAPKLGRVREDLDGAPRSFVVRPWVIIYEPSGDEGGVFVWHILDGRRNLPSIVRKQKR